MDKSIKQSLSLSLSDKLSGRKYQGICLSLNIEMDESINKLPSLLFSVMDESISKVNKYLFLTLISIKVFTHCMSVCQMICWWLQASVCQVIRSTVSLGCLSQLSRRVISKLYICHNGGMELSISYILSVNSIQYIIRIEYQQVIYLSVTLFQMDLSKICMLQRSKWSINSCIFVTVKWLKLSASYISLKMI